MSKNCKNRLYDEICRANPRIAGHKNGGFFLPGAPRLGLPLPREASPVRHALAVVRAVHMLGQGLGERGQVVGNPGGGTFGEQLIVQ